MRSHFFHRSLLTLSQTAFVGCNAPSADTTDTTIEPALKPSSAAQLDKAHSVDKATGDKATDDEAPATAAQSNAIETKDRPKPIAPAIAPGEYCYQTSDEIQDIDARLIVDASTGLSTERDTLSLESCDTVSATFQTDGIEAKYLTEYANRVETTEIFFDSGKSGTTVSNAVARGDRDVYRLTAQAAQQMIFSISSVENNAAFDVVSPGDLILSKEATKENLYLPETGEYKIIVGGTRGNAAYELSISIE